MKCNKKLAILIAAFLAAGFSGCGRVSVTGSGQQNEDHSQGTVNTGVDQNTGVVNSGLDQNKGVINSGLQANKDGQQVAGDPLRKPDGTCVNDVDRDNLCNEEDPDIDGDGIPNEEDPDIDGDGIPNVQDPDIDGDGIPNIDDNDIDGDGVANVNDSDLDGDGIPNFMDLDMDGDGVANIHDNDIDGDGIPNEEDPDIDGDGIPNAQDPDIDGDGIYNQDDNDIDGDGIPNTQDTDLDGDGIANDQDPDLDGDGIPNQQDVDANGDGQTDVPGSSASGGNVAYFSHSGSVTLDAILPGATQGQGVHLLEFQAIRDSATAKNADVGTIVPYDIQVKANPESVPLLMTVGGSAFRMKISYRLPGSSNAVLIGHTSPGSPLTINQLIAGVSMGNNTLMQTSNYPVFQGLLANPAYTQADMIIEIVDVNPALPAMEGIKLDYTIRANAQVKL